MPNRRGPTLRSQWLGKQLRDLREAADLTLRDVASYVQRDASSISRLEAGIHPARIPDVLAYVTLCRVSDPHRRDALVQLAQDAWQTGLWDHYKEGVLESLMDRVWLEARATEIRSFEALVVPGLLQSPAYAATVMRSSDEGRPHEDINRWVNVRLARQHILDQDQPPQLHVVLDESVLHRLVGGPKIMRDQLELLATLADRPAITISVLPWAAGAHASPEGCFDVLVMAVPYSDVGYMETPVGPVFVEREDVDPLMDRHQRLSAAALSRDESRKLISRIAKELDS